MPRNLLIDTDMLIDYLTAREEAVAELYAGVREGKERVILDDFIEAFEVVPLTIDIAQRGGVMWLAFINHSSENGSLEKDRKERG